MFFVGSLKNSGDSFRLFDKDCHLIDEIIADSVWPAGDSVTKKTMERDSKTLSWHTSTITGGTPKKENTENIIEAKNRNAILSKANNISGMVSTSSNVVNSRVNPDHVLISQVQTTGGVGKTDDDFIEISNPSNEPFDLKGYRLVKRAQNGISDALLKSWTNDTFIPANGYYLWANSGYTTISVAPDATTSGSISDDNGIAIRFGPLDTGTVINSVAWGKAQNAFVTGAVFPINPGANQSLSRKGIQNSGNNAADFEIELHSSPRNSQTPKSDSNY
jgi:hypothetical protein